MIIDDRTELMLCDLPCRILYDDVVAALDVEGFVDKYDFIYVPSKHTSNLGYAFINFLDSATASLFTARFAGYRFPGYMLIVWTLNRQTIAILFDINWLR